MGNGNEEKWNGFILFPSSFRLHPLLTPRLLLRVSVFSVANFCFPGFLSYP